MRNLEMYTGDATTYGNTLPMPICGIPYIMFIGEKAARSRRRHETFAPSNHEWRRDERAGNTVNRHDALKSVVLRYKIQRLHLLDDGSYGEEVLDVTVSLLPDVNPAPDSEPQHDPYADIQESLAEEIGEKSAALPSGMTKSNLFYGTYRSTPLGSHQHEHAISHKRGL